MMFSNDNQLGDAAELRKRAEEIALGNTALLPKNLEALSLEETVKMFHELQVHQIGRCRTRNCALHIRNWTWP